MELISLPLVLLLISSILSQQTKDITPTLTVQPQTSVFIGDTVTLSCEVHQSTGWEFTFIRPSNTEFTETTGTKTIRSVQVSDGGEYKCRAGRENPQRYTQYSQPITVTVQERPTPLLSVDPADHVFRGETVNLRCVINGGGVSSWQYSWYKDSIIQQNKLQYYTIRSVIESNAGKYTCKGTEIRGPRYSHISNAVTLTVLDKPQTVLSVSPQQWLTEGDSVTLMCEVINSSTGWTFSWFTVQSHSSDYDLVLNSSGGSKGIYTVSSVTVKHTGVYMCRAERGDPVYHTEYSNTQTLWITGVSPSVSLIIRPKRSQHFSSESLSLSCEDHSNSTGWTVRRYTNTLGTCSSSDIISTGTTSTCTIRSLNISDTGVYWCQSESGEKLHPVNISVHNGNVILDSPVHPVTEGDLLTLRCLYRDKKPSNLRAEFHKDKSVVQSQTTGDMMIISTVSKSHEGFYYCEHTDRGESPKSWISVRGIYQEEMSGLNILTFLLAVFPYLLATVVLVVKCYRLRDITPTLTVQPQTPVFIGDKVTLICEVHQSTGWEFIFTTPSNTQSTETTGTKTITSVQIFDGGEYWCRSRRKENPQVYTQDSEPITLTVQRSKPELTSDTEGSLLTGNTVTLKCHIDQSTGWRFNWYKHTQNTEKTTTETNSYTINRVKVSDGGQYWCRAGRGKPDYYTDYSDGLWINVTERPKPVVSVDPDTQLFRGETVTLRCDIQDTGDTEWTYSWTVEKTNNRNIITQCNTQECKIYNIQQTDSGKYTCRGKIRGQITEISDAVTLTVSSDKPHTVLSVSPQQWLTEGDSVTLMCEVINSSTGWTFSWFTVQSLRSLNRDVDYELVSNSNGGSKGNYTVSSVTVKHTGVYMCRAERGDPVYHTYYSNTQTLWITGVSPSVSLIIRPSRSQHFSSESLSLSCEDHSNSTGWTVRRYTDKLKPCSSSDTRSTGTTSTCTIRSLNTSDTGVYWCQSKSGEKLHPVNISVHNADVILDSPVHSVTEGDNLTLRCLYRDKKPSNLKAKFYKDGSLVQNQTSGDMMIIPTVSKSHEGFYYCKHPDRGKSPKSWISVRVSGVYQAEMSGLKILTFLLAVCPYLLATVMLVVKCYRLRAVGTHLAAGHSQVCGSLSEPPCTDIVQTQGGQGAGFTGRTLLAQPNLVPGAETGHPVAPMSGLLETPFVVLGQDIEVLSGLLQQNHPASTGRSELGEGCFPKYFIMGE
ncbi:Fc receptor-like protein 5 [Misgurnus anguillicaudatus]|uniref:Fc receptor-like protein 5 n=1 Tax=Misgurnus anguillicaudatus TaxID=75329 RepID=UPI003CCFC92B